MANEKSEPLQERLNNEEFRELIPYLKIEDLFLTQALYHKEWIDIIRISNEVGRYRVECCLCNKDMNFFDLNIHLSETVHINALNEVKQFHHPVYTYDKKSIKLASGEKLQKKDIIAAIARVKSEITSKAYEIKLRHIRRFLSNYYEQKQTKFDKKLLQVALATDAKTPHKIVVEVFLPMKTLLSVEFMAKGTKTWQRMLLCRDEIPKPNGSYYCALCGKNCGGIITVNAHFNGTAHKSNQINTVQMRCKYHRALTKNCIFRFGNEYLATVTPKGRDLFDAEVMRLLDFKNEPEKMGIAVTQAATNDEVTVEDQVGEVDNVDAQNVADIDAEGYEADGTGIEGNETYDADEVYEDEECDDAGEDVEETVVEDLTAEDETVTEDTTTTAIDTQNQNVNTSAERPTLPELSAHIAAKVKKLSTNFATFDSKPDEMIVAELDKEGLIGVEYVVQISNGEYGSYECTLCRVTANERKMQAHLIAYSHRLKYCEKHYPDTLTKYKNTIGHMKYFEFFSVMGPILERLATAIEKHHGRAIPYPTQTSTYRHKRPIIVETINNFNHASQFFGPSFANTLSREEIAELRNLKCPYTPPEVPNRYRIRFTTTPTDKIYLEQNSHDPRTWKSRDSVDRELRSKSPHDQHRDRSSRSRKHSQESDRRDIWQIYRDQISTDASEIEYSYMQYRKNPESHPNYDHEWNHFWKRRKDQLASEGISHRGYDFQPEWVRFFRDRLEQMFGEALQKSKIDARRRLNIPLDAEEDSRPSREVSPPRELRLRSPVRGNHASPLFKRHSDNSEPAIKKPCFDTDTLISQWNSQSKPMQQQQYSSESGWGSYSSNQYNSEPLAIPTANDKPNIIHVLRLMTALEDQLGSLGSKVMDLLSKALVLEKKCSNVELEQQILTVNNCSLLETAMEKLKGILFAGLLESHKIQGFNRVIQFTSHLLKHADNMGWRNNVSQDDNESTDSTKALQKILDVIQSKRTGLPTNQKSLSDTLKDLISSQGIDSTDDRSTEQAPHVNTSMLNRSNFNASNVGDNRINRNNSYPRPGFDEMKQDNFNSNMNFSMNRNTAFGISGRTMNYGGGNGSGNGSGILGVGGNNFNNYNKPNTNAGMNASGMNSRFLNQSNNEMAGYGQQTNNNYTNMNRMNTNNRNNFGLVGNSNAGIPNTGNANNSGNDNWGRFQPYSYQNK